MAAGKNAIEQSPPALAYIHIVVGEPNSSTLPRLQLGV